MATLEELLQTTSRTFALAIPLLPAPERLDVTLGYLVFRIADTLEDADNLMRDERIAALDDLTAALSQLTEEAAVEFTNRWAPRRPCEDDFYQRLMEQAPDVLLSLARRPEPVKRAVVRHARRSIAGMQKTLARADAAGRLSCGSIDELRDYCYFVAGVVGELLTELFEPGLRNPAVIDKLHADARWFGEGLQLVNILKDADADAESGRSYLPAGAPLEEVFAIAAGDLDRAGRYIENLRRASAPAGYIAFCRAPHEMALATLARLKTDGPGAKISRQQVVEILSGIAAECGEAALAGVNVAGVLTKEA